MPTHASYKPLHSPFGDSGCRSMQLWGGLFFGLNLPDSKVFAGDEGVARAASLQPIGWREIVRRRRQGILTASGGAAAFNLYADGGKR